MEEETKNDDIIEGAQGEGGTDGVAFNVYITRLAEIAFNAYGEDCNWKTFDGRDMPKFDAIGEPVREHWAAAVMAAEKQLRALEDCAKGKQNNPRHGEGHLRPRLPVAI